MGPCSIPFQGRAAWIMSSILHFPACPSPCLPLCCPWSAAILLLKITEQTPRQDPVAQREAARSLDCPGQGRGWPLARFAVCSDLQMSLHAKDCLCVYKKGSFGTALRLSLRLGPGTCLFQCISCKIGSWEKKMQRGRMCLLLLL